MKIAIIVPVFNGADVLPRFLHTIKSPSNQQPISLIAVDNASSDNSVALIMAAFPSATIVRNKTNRGFAGACNQGMRLALHRGAEYVMLANQDLSFESGWLGPLVDAHEQNPMLGAVQPLIMLYPETWLINSCGNALHYLGFGFTKCYRTEATATRSAGVTPAAYCSGSALFLSVSALKRVGVFDEDYFMYHEESDLCWRLRIAGYNPSVASSSRVFHEYVFSGNTSQKFALIERNRLSNLCKNYELKTLVLIMPMLIVWEAGLLLYSLLATLAGRKTLGFFDKLCVYAHFFRLDTWRLICLWRRKIARLRTVHDRALVTLFTDTIEFQDVKNPLLEHIANPVTKIYWQLIKKWI